VPPSTVGSIASHGGDPRAFARRKSVAKWPEKFSQTHKMARFEKFF